MPLQIYNTNITGSTAINMSMAAGESVGEPIIFSPLDLTGYEVKMQVGFPTPLVLSTLNGGITLVDAPSGSIQLNIAGSASEPFAAGAYPYEFWIVSPGGDPLRLWTGTFTVNPSSTDIP